MIKPKVFHYTLTADVPYTFTFDVYGINFFVKNLSQGNLQVSYGDSIDPTSYIIIPPTSSELISSYSIDNAESKTDSITVQSTASGDVEIRILDY